MLDSETKALLSRVAGDEAIDIGDPIWLRVLTCSSPLQRQDPAEITEVLTPICRNLVEHNVRTQNYAKLAWHGVEVLRSLKVEPAPRQSGVQRAIDTVCMLRLITKHVMELLRPADIRASLTLPSRAGGKQDGLTTAGGEDVLQSLAHTGLTVLLATEPKGLRYVLHAEVINLILVLASSQLYTTLLSTPLNVAPALEVLDAEGQAAASELLQYLLRHWIAQTKLPAGLKMHQAAPAAKLVAAADSAAGGMLSAMGRAAGSVLMLPLAAASMLSAPPPRSPLAAGCAMMLALLLQHAPPGGRSLSPYRQALSAMRDADTPPQLAPLSPSATSAASPPSPDPATRSQDPATRSRLPFSPAAQPEASTTGASVPRAQAEVSFRQLYEASASLLADGPSVLLLYSLLTICPAYLDYVLVRADVETLLLPLLQQLHATPPSAPNQLYTLQIILLILSQDASLATRLHKVVVPSVPWYRDRILLQVSLGSLVFMVVLKTAFQNLSLRSDVFLQTNSLGVLANLASSAVGLSSTASQQLVSLLLHLNRRSRRLRQLADRPDGSLDRSTALQAANVFEDMARMVLEIVNCVLTNELARNPELVYALLHRQDALQQLREHPRYADILANVWVVLDFLNPKVEEAARSTPGAAWSSGSVLDIIQSHLRSLHPNRLRRFPELIFRFDEEPSSEEFFLPYVWSLVVECSGLDFRQSCIVLYTPASLTVGKGEVGLPETLDLDANASGRDARGDGVRPSAGEALNAAEQLV